MLCTCGLMNCRFPTNCMCPTLIHIFPPSLPFLINNAAHYRPHRKLLPPPPLPPAIAPKQAGTNHQCRQHRTRNWRSHDLSNIPAALRGWFWYWSGGNRHDGGVGCVPWAAAAVELDLVDSVTGWALTVGREAGAGMRSGIAAGRRRHGRWWENRWVGLGWDKDSGWDTDSGWGRAAFKYWWDNGDTIYDGTVNSSLISSYIEAQMVLLVYTRPVF